MPDKSAEDTQVIHQVPAPPIRDISGKGQEQDKVSFQPQFQPQIQVQAQDIQLKTMNNLLMVATCNPTKIYAREKEIIQCSSIDLKPQNKQQQDFVDALLLLYSSNVAYVHLEQNPDGSVRVFFYVGVYKPKP